MSVSVYCYLECWTGSEWSFVGDLEPNFDHEYDPNVPELAPVPLLHSTQKELATILVDLKWAIRATEPFVPVVPRRGLPPDLSSSLAPYLRWFAEDPATAVSWFTKRELDAFNLPSQVMLRQAYVPVEAAHLFANCPDGFPYDRWPEGVPIKIAGWSRDGVEVRWRETYDSIVPVLSETIATAMGAFSSPDSVRLVVLVSR